MDNDWRIGVGCCSQPYNSPKPLPCLPVNVPFFILSYTAHCSTDIVRYTYTHAAQSSTSPRGFRWPCTIFSCSPCPFFISNRTLRLDELRKGARDKGREGCSVDLGRKIGKGGHYLWGIYFCLVSCLACLLFSSQSTRYTQRYNTLHEHLHITALYTHKRISFIPQPTTNKKKTTNSKFSLVRTKGKIITGDRMIKVTQREEEWRRKEVDEKGLNVNRVKRGAPFTGTTKGTGD